MDYLDENNSIYDDYKDHIFYLDREGFIQIVKIIPYMMIEKNMPVNTVNYLIIVISMI